MENKKEIKKEVKNKLQKLFNEKFCEDFEKYYQNEERKIEKESKDATIESQIFLNKILSFLNEQLVIRVEAIDAPQLNSNSNGKLEFDMWIKIKINQKGEINRTKW